MSNNIANMLIMQRLVIATVKFARLNPLMYAICGVISWELHTHLKTVLY